MKQIMITLLAGTILFGCKKKEDPAPATPGGGGTTTIPANGWKLGATNYTQVIAVRSSNFVAAYDATPSGSTPATNSFIAYFASVPTADSTYTIVSYPSTLTAGQVGIVGGLYATSSSYASTGTDATPVQATVTITGGKIKIVVPEVWVKKTVSGSTDSLKITGTIIEN